jgi:hypothetical protein
MDEAERGGSVLPIETHLAGQYTEWTVEQRNIDNEISATQITALYQHMPMVLAVNVVNSALVALVLASYLEQTRWWIFFGLVVSLTGVRGVALVSPQSRTCRS